MLRAGKPGEGRATMPEQHSSINSVDWDPEQDRADGTRGDGLRSAERFAEYARLREQAPVAWSDQLGGFFTLTRYADVTAAAVDTKRFRSGRPFIAMPDLVGQIPISLNPPEHRFFRRLLNPFFRPERMRDLEPLIRAFAVEHVEALIEAGESDAMTAFCRPLPARALATLLNLPEGAWQDLLAQFRRFDAVGWKPEQVNNMILGVFSEHIATVVAQRMAEPLDPDDDMFSGALATEIDGEEITVEQVIMIGVQMIAAGHATTADSLSSAIHRLAEDPDLQSRLRADLTLLPDAIEEFIRIDPPLHELSRTPADVVDLHGRTLPDGSAVSLNLPRPTEIPRCSTVRTTWTSRATPTGI
ncbi:hypothetical protein GCM10011609_35230 [Lentzea pudingi]|uniref:Cytochrome P450 n=1 Tax=Lentzea pudingi TaxID=1789439 RepID=A0ABQ2HXU2_9PSEU|nr:cytochrome P450 [Lentzea pudingi]GGM94725.1 hypothetical protein GCM10011609_35230 [Lentzea pudingi]